MLPPDSASKRCNTLYLVGKAYEKEYEQIARTPFIVGRGFISRRFLCFAVCFRRQQATALRFCRQVKSALWKAPLPTFFVAPAAMQQ